MNTVWLKTTQSEHVNKKLATQYVLNFMNLSLTHPIKNLKSKLLHCPRAPTQHESNNLTALHSHSNITPSP